MSKHEQTADIICTCIKEDVDTEKIYNRHICKR